MLLSSSAFASRSAMPRRFTCDGEGLSPPLDWSGAPPATRSFVLLCDDPDAPAGTWHHWAVYDIAADETGLAEGAALVDGRSGFRQAVNDSGDIGYGAPCPPRGHGWHHYQFRLLALSVELLPVGPEQSCRVIQREARKHTIAEASLIGLYQR